MVVRIENTFQTRSKSHIFSLRMELPFRERPTFIGDNEETHFHWREKFTLATMNFGHMTLISFVR